MQQKKPNNSELSPSVSLVRSISASYAHDRKTPQHSRISVTDAEIMLWHMTLVLAFEVALEASKVFYGASESHSPPPNRRPSRTS